MLQHLKAVWTFRYFWMSLVKMDLRARYRRSFLGIGWSLLHPIAMSAVFCAVFSHLVKSPDVMQGYPEYWRGYSAYLLAGMAVWEFIRNSTAIGCQALIHNEAYIRQCPLPYGIYPLRTVMGTGIHFLLSIFVTVCLISILKESFDPFAMLWAVIPMFVLLFLFCWSLATIAAFATVYFHDTSHLVEVGSQLFFFLTPIMYFRSLLGADGWIADINPVVIFLETIRNPLVTGETAAAGTYYTAIGMTAVFVGLAFGTIGWLQKKVIFQL